jgi:choline kinase
MLPSGEITVAQRMIATLHKSGLTQIAVITGPDDKKMEKQLAQYGVYFLQNPQPEKRIHRLRWAFVTCPVNVSGFI